MYTIVQAAQLTWINIKFSRTQRIIRFSLPTKWEITYISTKRALLISFLSIKELPDDNTVPVNTAKDGLYFAIPETWQIQCMNTTTYILDKVIHKDARGHTPYFILFWSYPTAILRHIQHPLTLISTFYSLFSYYNNPSSILHHLLK